MLSIHDFFFNQLNAMYNVLHSKTKADVKLYVDTYKRISKADYAKIVGEPYPETTK